MFGRSNLLEKYSEVTSNCILLISLETDIHDISGEFYFALSHPKVKVKHPNLLQVNRIVDTRNLASPCVAKIRYLDMLLSPATAGLIREWSGGAELFAPSPRDF